MQNFNLKFCFSVQSSALSQTTYFKIWVTLKVKVKWKLLSRVWLCVIPRIVVHGIFQARILEWVAFPFSRGSSQPRDGTQGWNSALPADSLPAEPQEKPKNNGVGSLSLLQGIFPTQELNRGLLLCRQILYQLSDQGNPWVTLDSALFSVSPSDSDLK